MENVGHFFHVFKSILQKTIISFQTVRHNLRLKLNYYHNLITLEQKFVCIQFSTP